MDRDAHIYCWWYEVCDGRAVVACKQENDRFLYALGTTSKPPLIGLLKRKK